MFVNQKDCIYSERLNVKVTATEVQKPGSVFLFLHVCLLLPLLRVSFDSIYSLSMQLFVAHSSNETPPLQLICAPSADTSRYWHGISRLYVFWSHFFGGAPDITVSALDAGNLSRVNREAIG